ncbi:MAG: type II toxin-antitoxin system HipA family toxin [Burkholderiaceae bacterium]|nr:type II toxin-antitoxin system HipA family toxin [Burkholderiaceae bacterium]
MPKALEVWLSGVHVGTLSQVEGRLSFTHAPVLLSGLTDNGIATVSSPLSQSLPLRAESFDDRATRPFFAGLLPEGGKRKLIAQRLQVSRQNDFALLDSLGGECAGAVTLLEPGQTPNAPDAPNTVRWLDATQLLEVLDEMPLRPMLAGDEGLRLSLAGAQDKLPVVAEGNRIGLPQFGAPSSHILKPPIPAIDGSVFNEGFCMALANAMKLDVAKAKIHRVADHPNQRHYLLVERYDRRSEAKDHRLHQEDFCQALGVAPEIKYQSEGGPNLANAFELLRRATRPSAPHTLKLLDFVVFNALIGNHDAHGKNFSLLYTPKGAVLAPLYDALCTAVYPTLTDKMAMKIGSKYKFSEVQALHWDQFAVQAALSPALVKKRIVEIAKRLPDLARVTLVSFEDQGNGHPILGQIVTLIEQRCSLTIRRLTAPTTDNAAVETTDEK